METTKETTTETTTTTTETTTPDATLTTETPAATTEAATETTTTPTLRRPEKIDDLVMTPNVRILYPDVRYEFIETRAENALVRPTRRVVLYRHLNSAKTGTIVRSSVIFCF